MSELISVCITTYNRAGLIKKTIDSILNQSYKDIEVIIVDDGSQDDTDNYINKHILPLDNRICFIKHNKNKGLAAARNTALEKSSGKYFTWCDDDDELEPTSIEERVELMEQHVETNPNLVVVYSSCSIHNESINRVVYQEPLINGKIENSIKKGIISTVPSSGLYHKELLIKIGGFDESLKSFVDHDFWFKLSENGLYALPIYKPLTKTYIYTHKKSMVTDVSKRIQYIEVFLRKWDSYMNAVVLNKDFFLQSYRLRVIGNLTVLMLVEHQYKNAKETYKYLKSTIPFGALNLFITKQLFKQILKKWMVFVLKKSK